MFPFQSPENLLCDVGVRWKIFYRPGLSLFCEAHKTQSEFTCVGGRQRRRHTEKKEKKNFFFGKTQLAGDVLRLGAREGDTHQRLFARCRLLLIALTQKGKKKIFFLLLVALCALNGSFSSSSSLQQQWIRFFSFFLFGSLCAREIFQL